MQTEQRCSGQESELVWICKEAREAVLKYRERKLRLKQSEKIDIEHIADAEQQTEKSEQISDRDYINYRFCDESELLHEVEVRLGVHAVEYEEANKRVQEEHEADRQSYRKAYQH